MREFVYVEPTDPVNDDWRPMFIYITEEEILKFYWEYWKSRMVVKYGKDSELISEEKCIEDFCTVHFAEEVKENANTTDR